MLWEPAARLLRLDRRPLLACWNRADDPVQQNLQAYLLEAGAAIAAATSGNAREPLYLRVHARVTSAELRGSDVENFLTPLAQEVRRRGLRVVLAHGTKSSERADLIEVGIARPGATLSEGWHEFQTIATGSADTKAWKERIRGALLDAMVATADDGPLAMVVAIRCSPRRAWVNLWKPLGDSLGPILGEPNPKNVFHPADDRITDLALHLEQDAAMGWDVGVRIWWRNV